MISLTDSIHGVSEVQIRAVVHLLDNDPSLLRALARLLAAEGHVVRTFTSAKDFLGHRKGRGPGCLVTALRMHGMGGLELQATLRSEGDSLPIIFLTKSGTIESSVLAMKAGADDFLTKPVNKRQISAAVKTALTRDAEMFAKRMHDDEMRKCDESLTPREHEVLAHIQTGALNKQIAGDLKTSERTVKAHRAHLMEKLNAHSAAELGSVARELSELRNN